MIFLDLKMVKSYSYACEPKVWLFVGEIIIREALSRASDCAGKTRA